jgi:ABC-type enterochelin transport system permease subunit
MYFFIQFILGILLGVTAYSIVNIVEKMHIADDEEYAMLKQKLWSSIFGVAITVVISAALLTAQISGLCNEKIKALDERVTDIEMVINEN